MTEEPISRRALIRLAFSRYLMALFALSAMFFIPAGTLAYWNAWLYLGIIFIPMAFVMIYLLKNNPELLERRMRFRERQATQKRVIGLSWIIFLLVYLIPGFDYRFGWSDVPVWVVLIAAVLVLLGYATVFWVFRENSYASRVIEVAQEQQVIDSGPYALIRHPMYVGSILVYTFSPLVLGSWWAMIPAMLIIPALIARIRNEEAVLRNDLPGYTAYCQKVRWRILPGVW